MSHRECSSSNPGPGAIKTRMRVSAGKERERWEETGSIFQLYEGCSGEVDDVNFRV